MCQNKQRMDSWDRYFIHNTNSKSASEGKVSTDSLLFILIKNKELSFIEYESWDICYRTEGTKTSSFFSFLLQLIYQHININGKPPETKKV